MRLYSGTAEQFVYDTTQNQIADKLRIAFENYYGHTVSPNEFASWTNSFQFLKTAIESNDLKENMMILEYELPYSSKRIDCMLFGSGSEGQNVLLVELKQWSKTDPSEINGNIVTFIGGAPRLHPHPALQVKEYGQMLLDFVETFNEKPEISLSACVYLHNYVRQISDPLFTTQYMTLIKEFPLFTKSDFNDKLGLPIDKTKHQF